MAREHRVRLAVPNLTAEQADRLADQLGDAATVTHETNLPVAPDATRIVMAVRAQKPATAGQRAAAQVTGALPDNTLTPAWEVVSA